MQHSIYASFGSNDKADQAFVDLLERGASVLDLVVITQKAYDQSGDRPSDGELPVEEHGCLASPPPLPAEVLENNPYLERDPFSPEPQGVKILDNLAYPGDLTLCLEKLGFNEQLAQDAESAVLRGGAFLIARIPSGSVDEYQAWEVIERFAGNIVAPINKNPYLG